MTNSLDLLNVLVVASASGRVGQRPWFYFTHPTIVTFTVESQILN